MYKIATEAGLTEISPEAVNLMTHAMEVRHTNSNRLCCFPMHRSRHQRRSPDSSLSPSVCLLQHHLKDILDACKRTKTLTPSGLAAAASSSSVSSASTTTTPLLSPHTVFNQPEGNTITARDMLTMVQHRPYLLGEDLPVNQERILLVQEDY
jgi:hypothetical protein